MLKSYYFSSSPPYSHQHHPARASVRACLPQVTVFGRDRPVWPQVFAHDRARRVLERLCRSVQGNGVLFFLCLPPVPFLFSLFFIHLEAYCGGLFRRGRYVTNSFGMFPLRPQRYREFLPATVNGEFSTARFVATFGDVEYQVSVSLKRALATHRSSFLYSPVPFFAHVCDQRLLGGLRFMIL